MPSFSKNAPQTVAEARNLLNPVIKRADYELEAPTIPPGYPGHDSFYWANGYRPKLWDTGFIRNVHSIPMPGGFFNSGSPGAEIRQAGAVLVSADEAANAENMPNAFWLYPGTSQEVSASRLWVAWPGQQTEDGQFGAKRAYLQASWDVNFSEQISSPIRVENDTGNQVVVRAGSPDDSGVRTFSANKEEGDNSTGSVWAGFQEDDVKRQLLADLRLYASRANLANVLDWHIQRYDDPVHRQWPFTRLGGSLLYRLGAAGAGLDLRSLIPGVWSRAYAKFRISLYESEAADQNALNLLSAEVRNRWGIFECSPLAAPGQPASVSNNHDVFHRRFESPWMRFNSGDYQSELNLAIEGILAISDNVQQSYTVNAVIDADYFRIA